MTTRQNSNPYADSPQADRPYADRPHADSPHADRPQAGRPESLPPESATAERSGKRERRVPTFPEEQVRVSAWADPVLDRLGHDPRSGYVERYWLSILGPTCLLLLRRLATELEQQPDGFTLETGQWALELGIGMKGGKNGPFWRAVDRACRFGAAQRNGDLLAVRRRLPPLTNRQVERLPIGLANAHRQWAEARLAQPTRRTVTKWSDDRGNPRPPSTPLEDAA